MDLSNLTIQNSAGLGLFGLITASIYIIPILLVVTKERVMDAS